MTKVIAAVLRHLAFQQHMKGFEPSLLDKLFDDESHAPIPTTSCQLSLEELESIVARDIGSLLNMRIMLEEEDLYGLPECKRSLLTYGLNDLSGLSLANFYDRSYIYQSLIKAIERHEPRLQYVSVSSEINERATNVLCFGIGAVLLVGPAREPVSLGAMLQPPTLRYSVSHGRG